MFDDFRGGPLSREERARVGGSAAAASVIFFLLVALLLSTSAATRHLVEKLTQVDFATKAPKPPPPPLPVAAAAAPPQNARPKMARKELKPPDHVSDEKPKESDAPLSNAEPAGPEDGFLTGAVGGTGTARTGGGAPTPPPKPEPITPPVLASGNSRLQYTATARRKEIEGTVVVAFDVLENGTVTNVTIISGPNELRDIVLKGVATWRFQPARRGGKPIRQHLIKSIVFRLSDE